MYFGIDIGGTSIKYGIIDNNMKIVEKWSVPTETMSEEALLCQLSNIITETAKKYSFDFVGIGAPGYVNDATGIIEGSGNTPFKHTQVKGYLESATGHKVLLGNDANCAAIAEYVLGDKKVNNSIMLTLGTGVGGGIILNNSLYCGTNGCAGELGHMVIVHDGLECGCGKKGCFEQYASTTALIRMTKDEIENGSSLMAQEMKDRLDEVDGKCVFEYRKRGCEGADRVIKQYIDYLVCGVENIIDILAPDEIVLAGGITNDKDILMPYIKAIFSGRCDIRISKLKNDAGLYGAALLGYKS